MPAPANIQVVLDHGLKQIDEPGFGKRIRSKELASFGNAHNDVNGTQTLWADPQGQVVMLKPRQMDSTWLDSTQAVPWIIRLAQMDVNVTDLATFAIQEKPVFGNTANPGIYHIATAVGSYPAARPPEEHPFPTTDPSLVRVSPGYDPVAPDT